MNIYSNELFCTEVKMARDGPWYAPASGTLLLVPTIPQVLQCSGYKGPGLIPFQQF